MSVLRLIAKPRPQGAIAEKPRGRAACPGRVPSLSAYAYQSSVSLLLAVTALRALVLTAWAERDAQRAENAQLIDERNQLAGQNDRLRHLIRQLQRMQFGRRSEKLDPDQFNLALEDLEQAVAESEAEQEKADPALRQARSEKRRVGRGPLPEHLPRVG